MHIFFNQIANIDEPHLIFRFKHIAKMRRALAEQIKEESKGRKLNQDYIDGMNHVLDAMDDALLEQSESTP